MNNILIVTAVGFIVLTVVFFWLLLKSRFIPRLISGFGIFASCLVTVLGFANLIVPRYSALLASGWFPILIAEVATGLWLLWRDADFDGLISLIVRSDLAPGRSAVSTSER